MKIISVINEEGATTKAGRVEPQTFMHTRPMAGKKKTIVGKTWFSWHEDRKISGYKGFQSEVITNSFVKGHCTVTIMSPTPTTLTEKEGKRKVGKEVKLCRSQNNYPKLLCFWAFCDLNAPLASHMWMGFCVCPRAVRHQCRDELLQSFLSAPIVFHLELDPNICPSSPSPIGRCS